MSTDLVFRSRTKRPESPSLVDPRLQARRAEVERDHGRRRRRWVVAAAAVTAVAVGVLALSQSPVLDVDRVEIRGAAGRDQAEARKAAGIALGSPTVSVDGSNVEARLEALPWVERASVSRSWPGLVRIKLVQRTPVAVVGTGSSAVEVDQAGQAITADRGRDLPLIGGDPVQVGEELSATQQWVGTTIAGLPSDLRRQVATARATSSGIRLTLDDGIEVRWGDASQPTAKADALGVLLDQAERETIATIDVRVPRAATVTRS